MSIHRLAMLMIVVVACLGFASLAEACPGCKDAIAETDPSKSGIVQGYFYSILFMMSMPFLLLGSFGGYLYVKVRKTNAQRDAESKAALPSTSYMPNSAMRRRPMSSATLAASPLTSGGREPAGA